MELDNLEDDEDDPFANLDKQTVNALNFGGFQDENEDQPEENRPKTRQEIMNEVIAKSKMYKAEKAKERIEQENIRNELDNDFAEIQMLLATNKRKRSDEKADKDDDFEKTVRELAFDARARPTDRLKTPQEIAAEEKQKLDRLEVLFILKILIV